LAFQVFPVRIGILRSTRNDTKEPDVIMPRRRMVVGGRELDLTANDVLDKMHNVEPEPIREHLVEIGDKEFPPKQVLAAVTGWDRQSFTTMEANRVLARLGFNCCRIGYRSHGAAREEQSPIERRLFAAESALAVAQEAIAGLANRVAKLEASR
jgi:hypothetical protein